LAVSLAETSDFSMRRQAHDVMGFPEDRRGDRSGAFGAPRQNPVDLGWIVHQPGHLGRDRRKLGHGKIRLTRIPNRFRKNELEAVWRGGRYVVLLVASVHVVLDHGL